MVLMSNCKKFIYFPKFFSKKKCGQKWSMCCETDSVMICEIHLGILNNWEQNYKHLKIIPSLTRAPQLSLWYLVSILFIRMAVRPWNRSSGGTFVLPRFRDIRQVGQWMRIKYIFCNYITNAQLLKYDVHYQF